MPSRHPEGDVRRAFYLSYDDTNCEYLTGEQIDEKLDAGIDVVSATYVTPYPPGFPVLVPGQVVSREILQFMRDLDTKEIHGYEPNFGYRVYTEKAIEMVGAAVGLPSNGHSPASEAPSSKAPKKKPTKRPGNGSDRDLPEVGQDELLGEQQPGDAVTTGYLERLAVEPLPGGEVGDAARLSLVTCRRGLPSGSTAATA